MAQTLGVGPASNSSAFTGTVAVALNGTTAGRSIACLAWISLTSTGTISSVACTGESNLSSAGAIAGAAIGGNDYRLELFYLSNNTGGGDKTITVTASGVNVFLAACAVEIAGGDTSGWLGTATVSATGSSSTPSVSITTATANEFLIGMVVTTNATQTPGTGYTVIALPEQADQQQGQYNLDGGAAGARAFDFTLGASASWFIVAAGFKLGGGGGGGTMLERTGMSGMGKRGMDGRCNA